MREDPTGLKDGVPMELLEQGALAVLALFAVAFNLIYVLIAVVTVVAIILSVAALGFAFIKAFSYKGGRGASLPSIWLLWTFHTSTGFFALYVLEQTEYAIGMVVTGAMLALVVGKKREYRHAVSESVLTSGGSPQ